jgi:hypothetical protein
LRSSCVLEFALTGKLMTSLDKAMIGAVRMTQSLDPPYTHQGPNYPAFLGELAVLKEDASLKFLKPWAKPISH